MMTDEDIIELFFARSDKALEVLAERYGGVMYRVSQNILRNEQDAKECVNDAYLALWNAIPPARPNPLCPYACRVCRNISLTRYRYDRAAKRDRRDDVSLEQLGDVIGAREEEEGALTQLLNEWLGGLNRVNLYIFMRRYWFYDAVSEIARATGLTETAVYLRLDRMKKSLSKFLCKRGYGYEAK